VSRISLLIEYAFISTKEKGKRSTGPASHSGSRLNRVTQSAYVSSEGHSHRYKRATHTGAHTATQTNQYSESQRVSHRARRENQNYAHTLAKFCVLTNFAVYVRILL